MSENPYAQAGQFGLDGGADDIPPTPQRTSIMAIFSLVLSLICCIPGLGLLGALFGIGALVGISSSRGRVGGKGLAITGIVIGLIVTTLWVLAAYGFSAMAGKMGAYAQIVQSAESGDTGGVQAWMTSGPSDAQIGSFATDFASDWGAYQSTPQGIRDLIGAYLDLGASMEVVNTAQQDYQQLFPLPIETDQGLTLVIVAMDSGGQIHTPSQLPKTENIGYLRPDGSIRWMVDP